MIIGLLAGYTLNSFKTTIKKLNFFAKMGLLHIVIGGVFYGTGINPIVKRICTPA